MATINSHTALIFFATYVVLLRLRSPCYCSRNETRGG